MERVFSLSFWGDMGGNSYPGTHVNPIILVRIVVFQVEVAILKETMSDEEVMGFISRKNHSLRNKSH